MKIKIIKDIPGYKAGEIIILLGDTEDTFGHIPGYEFTRNFLINKGFAEIVKDNIDIEHIRTNISYYMDKNSDDFEFVKSYRIVKAVIDQLEKYSRQERMYEIGLKIGSNGKFAARGLKGKQVTFSILPKGKLSTIEKVIELCDPELKLLFEVK